MCRVLSATDSDVSRSLSLRQGHYGSAPNLLMHTAKRNRVQQTFEVVYAELSLVVLCFKSFQVGDWR